MYSLCDSSGGAAEPSLFDQYEQFYQQAPESAEADVECPILILCNNELAFIV